MIRPGTQEDVARICAIWNQAIRETTATFTTIEKTEGDLGKLLQTQPVLMAGEHGFASYGPFRSGPGYAGVIEHSLYVAPDAARQGIGRALLRAVEAHAQRSGARVMIGAICGENAPALALHRAEDFVQTGLMPGIGHKFGRALDLVLLQKNLVAAPE